MMVVPALALEQSPGREIYAFGIDGKHVPRFAAVSRARRDDETDDFALAGYQRPEVSRHIAEIRAYLESEGAMVPNAVVLAFDPTVTFEETAKRSHGEAARTGMLKIPLSGDGERKVGFVVDGQQRIAAIREAELENGFPMFAIGFVARSEAEQKEQFLLVNATKPLPRGLIHELLPGVEGRLPSHLEARRVPAALVEILNNDKRSPLYRTIRTATNPAGWITDNSMLRMLENSLSDGLLWEIGDTVDDSEDLEQMTYVLFHFWGAVKEVWTDIWELKPRQSRLLHGAGVVSLGFLMELMVVRYTGEDYSSREFFETELRLMKPHCHWTQGTWDFGPDQRRRWDEVQNVARDVQMLAEHLCRVYRRASRKGKSARRSLAS